MTRKQTFVAGALVLALVGRPQAQDNPQATSGSWRPTIVGFSLESLGAGDKRPWSAELTHRVGTVFWPRTGRIMPRVSPRAVTSRPKAL
jgi:hypothetical protein